MRERCRLQLRWETCNIQSATGWTQTDPLFLQPTAARAPRTMQIGLRLTFQAFDGASHQCNQKQVQR